jgi:hypothetical protein
VSEEKDSAAEKPATDAVAPTSETFPIMPRPPKSHFWPKRDEAQRRRDLQVRRIGRAVVRAEPTLKDPKFRPLLLSFARLTLLIEKAYDRIADKDDLISPETGELGSSLDTISRLIAQQTKLGAALGLSPDVVPATPNRGFDLTAALDRADRIHKQRYGGEDIEDVEPEKRS